MRNAVLLLLGIVLVSCSSPPKNPEDIYDFRMQAEMYLDSGNRQADRGNPEQALILIDEAMRLAVAADDSGLRIRVGLSRGNVLFSQGYREEASQAWNKALGEAERMGTSALDAKASKDALASGELVAVCRVHIARGRLLSSIGQVDSKTVAQSVRDEVSRDLGQIKSDRLYAAFASTVIGLAERELGRYTAAETAVKRSLDIHEKDRYFELAGYDWFLIASCRSLSGDYKGAQQALESAMGLDRRVENTWGLASDWRALGDVHKKAGDREAARAAYQRAAEIFRVLDNEAAAEATLSRIE
jgi:tetratricopeptide (TPR) repeat protein